MTSLIELVQATQSYFQSQVLKTIESVNDSEEFDMYLDNLQLDCEFISDEVSSETKAYSFVFEFTQLLKTYKFNDIAKVLEIGLAYASIQINNENN
jgi:hypothetical protein